MTLFAPPWFQDLTVRKDYEVVPIGLTVYDQGAEGTPIDLNFVSLYGIFYFHNCHLDPRLSPSIHKYGDVFTHSGLRAACDEPFGREPIGHELRVERLSRDE